MALSDSSESCIKLQLTVNKAGREVVKRITAKGNEVVEVNGFTYVRKRKAPQVHQQEPSLKRLQQAHLGVIAPAPSAAKFIQPQLLQQQQQQDHSVAGDESGPAVASSQEAGPMAASQAGSMEAGALSTEECNGSQVHVQLLPHKQVEPGDGELVKAATLELHMDAAAQAHSYPTTPARPLCAEVIPAEASRQLSPEGLGAQLASCLPALCPALVKLHFVVARALDAAVHQAPVPAPRIAHALSQAFAGLLEGEVAAYRQQLVAAAVQSCEGHQVGVVQGRLQVQEQQGCVVQVVEQQQGQAGQAQEQQVEADAAPAGAGAAPEFAGLPPFLRDAVTQGSTLVASLQQQLARLEAEEASWLALQRAYCPPARAPAADAGATEKQQQQQQLLPCEGQHHQQRNGGEQPQQQAGGAPGGLQPCAAAPEQGAAGTAGGAAALQDQEKRGSRAVDGQAAEGTPRPPSPGAGAGADTGAKMEAEAIAAAQALPEEQPPSALEQPLGPTGPNVPAQEPAGGVEAAQLQGEQHREGQQAGQQQGEQQADPSEEAAAMEGIAPASRSSEEAAAAGKAAPADAYVRALEEARAQAGARLMMQVELLASRLARVELMVGRAEQVANAMQADYHQDRFRTFPHVNSPAWLIRRITQTRPELWEGATLAAQV